MVISDDLYINICAKEAGDIHHPILWRFYMRLRLIGECAGPFAGSKRGVACNGSVACFLSYMLHLNLREDSVQKRKARKAIACGLLNFIPERCRM
jgi:hypothetical protein